MNKDYDSSRIEHVTAVAAAAYAIASLNAPTIQEQGRISKGPEPSLTRMKSKMKESTDLMSESGEGSMRGPEKAPEITRILTSTENLKRQDSKSLNSAKDLKTDGAEQITVVSTTRPKITVPKPDPPPTSKPATPPPKIERQVSARSGIDGTDADAWEIAELSKIQMRYEKINAGILSWENKKKEKARNRLKKTEGDASEEIRSKASKRFRAEMIDIDKIAGAAKAKAAERQRNEEFKAKGKANTIRRTGKLPRTCFCF
ncbi:REMORIN FAMILY PROTEIN [Salix purpurea]|uniref:REMORIN FAMILY PROTEIN n=1 Tax=Salix purpurea TaxID=77065 RepID=A0A9Q0UAW3_SALPP|nr:REMORIN FAMILY PROTEIN [Salix purpurea]